MEYLIPEAVFVGLPQWALLAIAAAALAVLSLGADRLVDGAVGLSFRFGLPQVIVGATVVSLGTTSPECAVSVMAAWQGDAGLALGNAIGSVIADTGLIFGIGCLLRSLPADRFTLARQGWIQIGAGVLLAGGCYAAYAWSGPQAALPRGFGFGPAGAAAGVPLLLGPLEPWPRLHLRARRTAAAAVLRWRSPP